MVLSITGHFPKNIKQLIKKYFQTKGKKGKQFFNPIPKQFLTKQTEPKIVVMNRARKQPSLTVGFAIDSNLYNDKMDIMLKLFCIIFGNNPNSRLYYEIREKATIAYSMDCNYLLFQDVGFFYIHLSFDKHSLFRNKLLDTKKGVLFLIIKEIKKVKKKGITSSELKKAKIFLKSQYCLSREKNENINNFFSLQCIFNKPMIDFNKQDKLIDSITKSDMNKMIQQLLDMKKLNLNLFGKYSEKKVKTYVRKLL